MHIRWNHQSQRRPINKTQLLPPCVGYYWWLLAVVGVVRLTLVHNLVATREKSPQKKKKKERRSINIYVHKPKPPLVSLCSQWKNESHNIGWFKECWQIPYSSYCISCLSRNSKLTVNDQLSGHWQCGDEWSCGIWEVKAWEVDERRQRLLHTTRTFFRVNLPLCMWSKKYVLVTVLV